MPKQRKYKEAPIAQYTLYINSNGNLISEKSYVNIEEINALFEARNKDYQGFHTLQLVLNYAKELVDDTHKEVVRTATQKLTK